MKPLWVLPLLALLATPGPQKKRVYEEIDVPDGGSITGTVLWKGERPRIEPFRIDKNIETCQVGDSPTKPSRRLVISEAGGVEMTVVYLEKMAKGKPLFTLPKKQRLDQKGCEYHPRMFVLPRKGKLEMTTSDDTLHNIHMRGAAPYNIAFPKKGMVETRPFRRVGIARVVCDAGHGWMTGYIHVVDHPYYVITDKEGKFQIEDIPPGKYTLNAWHEGWRIVEKDSVKDPRTGEESIKGYVFSDPIVLSQEVEVTPLKETQVTFELSED
ncbi:MAG: hypothetical protein O7H41_06140 [Planctomycetota bacterium]|nr:hypothetical protein [Planctomycetota bacterium]